jgi:cytochrome P450
MTFNPSRFLGDHPERGPQTLVFGFGRRICPGRILADSNIYLTIAMSLAAFEIRKPDGVDVQADFLPGITSHPAPFKMSVRLRNERYRDMVCSVLDEHPLNSRDADVVREMLG